MFIRPDPSPAAESGHLVEIVELKWLLAGHGVRLHVELLQHDREYARRTLEHAASLPNATLREAAQRLREHLGL
jgi:hypothetical protein